MKSFLQIIPFLPAFVLATLVSCGGESSKETVTKTESSSAPRGSVGSSAAPPLVNSALTWGNEEKAFSVINNMEQIINLTAKSVGGFKQVNYQVLESGTTCKKGEGFEKVEIDKTGSLNIHPISATSEPCKVVVQASDGVSIIKQEIDIDSISSVSFDENQVFECF